MPGRRLEIAAVSTTAAAAAAAGVWLAASARAQPVDHATFVGAAACAECHASVAEQWKSGRHSKMVRPATEASVLGDFGAGEIRLRGQQYRLRAEAGRFYIGESYLTGKPREHRVDYTLGNRRIQHYLTRLPDGWIVVLPPSWDVQRREWFHNMEIVRPDEDTRTPLQVWNKNCHGCHVSQQQRNFDAATKSYATTWVDSGTSCERCHGPGSRHVERYREQDRYAADKNRYIVKPTRLPAREATMVCAQCHSLRDVVADGFTAGADFYDHFMPLLEYGPRSEQDPAYWADGRPRRFSNDAFGLWQSACFLKGQATCSSCHRDVHEPDVDRNPQLDARNDRLCVRCHEQIGRDVPAHTRHAAASPGSSCVECHMPRAVFSIKAAIRDHSIGLPAPENTARFGIPNACNDCHKDKRPEWAAERLNAWYGKGRRGKYVERASAFTLARARKPEAVERLARIAANLEEPPLIRANAIGYLSRFPGRAAEEALLGALASDEPALRAVAALNLAGADRPPETLAPALVVALRDERRTVRVGAAFSLVGLGVRRLEGADGARFEAAKRDYVARARYNADDAQTQLDLGKFLLLNGDFAGSSAALRDSKNLDATLNVEYFLALADVGAGRPGEARERLAKIRRDDPYFAAARTLLAKLR